MSAAAISRGVSNAWASKSRQRLKFEAVAESVGLKSLEDWYHRNTDIARKAKPIFSK
jgi:hypothetical protein